MTEQQTASQSDQATEQEPGRNDLITIHHTDLGSEAEIAYKALGHYEQLGWTRGNLPESSADPSGEPSGDLSSPAADDTSTPASQQTGGMSAAVRRSAGLGSSSSAPAGDATDA